MSASQRDKAQYIRDVWAKSSYREMGNIGLHTKYVNLFINGMYWGLYNISERIDGDFMSSYLGGKEEDYDVIKDNDAEAVTGNKDQWNTLIGMIRDSIETNEDYFELLGKNADGSDNTELPAYVNATSLADYMILNFYSANLDWDHHNWAAARQHEDNTDGFRFLTWDQEQTLLDTTHNITKEFNADCPSEIFQGMIINDEFKVLFADRVQKHMFEKGQLTAETTSANWDSLGTIISSAIYGESARWGDYRMTIDSAGRGPHQNYTIENWEAERERLFTGYFPFRTDTVLRQFKVNGWFPAINSPQFNQYGDTVMEDFLLIMTADSGDVFYSTNGSDPRLAGGEVAPSGDLYNTPFTLDTGTTIVKARTKVGEVWSTLREGQYTIVVEKEEEEVSRLHSKMLAQAMKVYPNPAENTMHYDIPQQNTVVQLDIYSISGQLLISHCVTSNMGTIDISQLNSGIYFIKANDSKLPIERLIKN